MNTHAANNSVVEDARPETQQAIMERLLSIQEAKTLVGCGTTHFYGLIGSGQIAARKLGKRTLIPESSLRAFIASLPHATITTGRGNAA